MPQMGGRFKDGKRKGWRWEIYPDPASPTGYTRKVWNPKDSSNGGKPTEFFEAHDYDADVEDEKEIAAATARRAARQAELDAKDEKNYQRLEQRADAQQRYNRDVLDRTDKRATKDRQSREEIAKLDRKTQVQLARDKAKEDRRQFDATFGLDVIKANASMRGPLNAFQGFQAARATQDAGFSPFAAALRPAGNTAYGGGTAKPGGPPVPLTVGTMAAELAGSKAAYGPTGGTTAAGAPGQAGTDAYGRSALSPEQQAQLAPASQTFRNGLANAKQGQIENLTPNELKALISAGDYEGYDTDSELEFWKRSRPGQRSAMAA